LPSGRNHRHIRLALYATLALSFVWGVATLYARAQAFTAADRFTLHHQFYPAFVALTAEEAFSNAGLRELPRRIRINSLLDRPVYYFLAPDERWVGVYADNGERLEGVSPNIAALIASRAHADAPARHVQTVATLYRIAVDDALGTEVHVSASTGEIVRRTTRRGRALAWIRPEGEPGVTHPVATDEGSVDPRLFTILPRSAFVVVPGNTLPREIELTRIGGDPSFVFYAEWDRGWVVRVGPQGPVDVRALVGR
jgi:hypothetical protein